MRMPREIRNFFGGGRPTPPPAPDPAAQYAAMQAAELAAYPQRRKTELEARMGIGQYAGLGDADYARAMREVDIENADAMAAAALSERQRYGLSYIEQGRKELQASDPEAFALRQQLGTELNASNAFEQATDSPSFGALPTAAVQAQVTAIPTLTTGNVTDGGGTTDTLRRTMEARINSDLALGGRLSDDEAATLQQAVLRDQVSRGNWRGNAAMFQSALEADEYSRARAKTRSDAAESWLRSGQTTLDAADRVRQEGNLLAQQGFENTHRNTAQNNAAAQQDYANAYQTQMANNANLQQVFNNTQQAIAQRNATKQQHIANRQGFVFGQPLSAQYGQLAGAQAGAAPFMPANAQAPGLNANAGPLGVQAGTNIYGTQMQGYAAAANNYTSPWATMLGVGANLGSAWLLSGRGR